MTPLDGFAGAEHSRTRAKAGLPVAAGQKQR